jgi:uncharacterized membrane protein
MVIQIPSPLNGYINLGDALILFAAWLIPPVYGFLAAGIGSALADLFSGYLVYAPATFVIKGCIALVAYYLYKVISRKSDGVVSRVISAVVAELAMIIGYFVFEGFLYGFAPSLVNIPPNAVQGVAGVVLGVLLITIFKKYNIFKK